MRDFITQLNTCWNLNKDIKIFESSFMSTSQVFNFHKSLFKYSSQETTKHVLLKIKYHNQNILSLCWMVRLISEKHEKFVSTVEQVPTQSG